MEKKGLGGMREERVREGRLDFKVTDISFKQTQHDDYNTFMSLITTVHVQSSESSLSSGSTACVRPR